MKVLIIDDDAALLERFAGALARHHHQVTCASTAAEGLATVAEINPELVLLDLMLQTRSGLAVLRQLRAERPGLEVIVFTSRGAVVTAFSAMELRGLDAAEPNGHLAEIELILSEELRDAPRVQQSLPFEDIDPELAGFGPAFLEQQRFIAKVAQSNSAVLLRGETGSGKEMVARAIHRRSLRSERPLVVLDCAAINENLLQSELFGHEKGAFTGAARMKQGMFEVADGGTAFLDEIGDLSPAVQAGLLRVLENSSFRRLGGTRELKVDVRLIAATNRPLERMMRAGGFREDLYFRLNTIHLTLLPLRRRRDEIPCLVEHLVARHNARDQTKRAVSPSAMALLMAYDWPGNIREMRHVIERALVVAEQPLIGPLDLPAELRRKGGPQQVEDSGAVGTLGELEARHIARVLAAVHGHRANAAQILGISERNLYRKIQTYNLDSDPEAGSFSA